MHRQPPPKPRFAEKARAAAHRPKRDIFSEVGPFVQQHMSGSGHQGHSCPAR
jgi:hypothetical protein